MPIKQRPGNKQGSNSDSTQQVGLGSLLAKDSTLVGGIDKKELTRALARGTGQLQPTRKGRGRWNSVRFARGYEPGQKVRVRERKTDPPPKKTLNHDKTRLVTLRTLFRGHGPRNPSHEEVHLQQSSEISNPEMRETRWVACKYHKKPHNTFPPRMSVRQAHWGVR